MDEDYKNRENGTRISRFDVIESKIDIMCDKLDSHIQSCGLVTKNIHERLGSGSIKFALHDREVIDLKERVKEIEKSEREKEKSRQQHRAALAIALITALFNVVVATILLRGG